MSALLRLSRNPCRLPQYPVCHIRHAEPQRSAHSRRGTGRAADNAHRSDGQPGGPPPRSPTRDPASGPAAPNGRGAVDRSPPRRWDKEARDVRSTKRTGVLVALGVATALVLTACGPGAEDAGTTTVDDGTFSMFIGEPENPLVPGNTTEDQG